MTEPALLMVDVNSYRIPTDLKKHYAAGRRALGVKVTQGTNYTWTQALAIIDLWHKLGGTCVLYHFLVAGVPGEDQARYFLKVIAPHVKPDDVVCADLEGQPQSYRQWSKGEARRTWRAFRKAVDKASDRKRRRWVYGTYYFLRDNKIRPPRLRVGRRWRLWLAGYQNTPPPCPPGWRHWVAWQYTNAAQKVPGMPASLDESILRNALVAPPAPKLPRRTRRLITQATRALNAAKRLDTDDRKAVAGLVAAGEAALKR